MKKTIRNCLLLTLLFFLVGCGERLETPTNVKITGDVLTWNQVTNASGYVVKVGHSSRNIL